MAAPTRADIPRSTIQAGKPKTFWTSRSPEDRLFLSVLAISFGVHVVAFAIGDFSWLNEPSPMIDEWVMDAELVADIDVGAPVKSALPDAKEDEEERVPDKMLPQLPNKFAIKDQAVKEEVVADEVTKPEEKPEEKKAEVKSDETKDINIRTDEKEVNKLKKEDALKRLALERLRMQEKTDKELKAQENDPLARLRAEVSKRKKLNSGATGIGSARNEYSGTLKNAVRRNYALPEAYNLKNANIKVVIAITVTERGELLEMNVYQPSGDKAFDELAMKAVRASAPLPQPPRGMAGQQILLQFTPRSF